MTDSVRAEVAELHRLGPLPRESDEPEGDLQHRATLIDALRQGPPPTRDELALLFRLFPDEGDTSFGLAWPLLHAVERGEDIAFAGAFVDGLPDTIPGAREWMETLAMRQLNVEKSRADLVSAGLRARPAARSMLIGLLADITSGPADAVSDRARLALASLTA